jgi:hypothetical protein
VNKETAGQSRLRRIGIDIARVALSGLGRAEKGIAISASAAASSTPPIFPQACPDRTCRAVCSCRPARYPAGRFRPSGVAAREKPLFRPASRRQKCRSRGFGQEVRSYNSCLLAHAAARRRIVFRVLGRKLHVEFLRDRHRTAQTCRTNGHQQYSAHGAPISTRIIRQPACTSKWHAIVFRRSTGQTPSATAPSPLSHAPLICSRAQPVTAGSTASRH